MVKVIRTGILGKEMRETFFRKRSKFELNGDCCGDGHCRRYAD